MLPNPQTLIEEFLRIVTIAGVKVPPGALTFDSLNAPHEPSTLPRGKMAVYVFSLNGECLKVGKAGPRSNARFTSQHYYPKSSNSNLAKSLLDLSLPDFSEADIGPWIKKNVDRINFLLDVSCDVPVLNLLESFLQCRLRPRFEGFKSQR